LPQRPDIPRQSRQAIIFRLAALFLCSSGEIVEFGVDVNEWDNLFERRAIGRTKISIQAKILFNKPQRPVIGHVHDATNNGARIQADSLRLLPLTFELSFDNFKTARDCRLIWRNANLLGIAFLS
jgi:hypothetical protein